MTLIHRLFMIPLLLFAIPGTGLRADIIGGSEVRSNDEIQNSIVALYQQTSASSGALCTASILAQDIALTAAHCVSGGSTNIVLIFGHSLQARRNNASNSRRVSKILVNSRYGSGGSGMDQGDIALVRFEGGLPSGYQAADLLSTDSILKKGQRVTLAGYGISNASSHTGAGVLRKAQVTLLDPRPGRSEMILDQTHGAGACHGDSGGPAFIKMGSRTVLVGVTNRGYPNRAPDNCASDVVYAKVSAFYPWIQRGIQELRSSR